jgi:hypothetical protein
MGGTMTKDITAVVIITWCSLLFAASNDTLSGIVKDESGTALSGAIISLVKQTALKDTTDNAGTFCIIIPTIVVTGNNPLVKKNTVRIGIVEKSLQVFSTSEYENVTVSLFQCNGNLIYTEKLGTMKPGGVHQVSLPDLSTGYYLVKIVSGESQITLSMLSTGQNYHLGSIQPATFQKINITAAVENAIDTLVFSKSGYVTAKIGIDTYGKKNIAVVLKKGTSDIACSVPAMPAINTLTANTKMPDPFKFMDGHRMTSKAEWLCRRQEIKAMAYEYIYGPKPPKPEKVEASLSGSTLTITCTHNGKTGSFSVKITGVPSGDGPFPAFITFGTMALMSLPAGIASMAIPEQTISSEANPRPPKGVFNTLYPEYNDNTGSLIGWAWGISRIIDALEMTPAAKIDPKKIGLMGCSRWGKGAGMGIFDDRVALVVPLSPGSGLTSTWRIAETAGKVQTASEIYGEQSWMGTKFKNFGGSATNKLPIDQHEVIAMCAPRPILVLEGTSDSWNCPQCVYHCMKYAKMVYEALGIPDYIGFSHPAHGHCGASSNATSQAYFKAFCERFLLGKNTTTAGMFTESFSFDKTKWQDGEIPVLEGEMPSISNNKE